MKRGTPEYKTELQKISQEICEGVLGWETLEYRNRDCLDFHEVSVGTIKNIIELAFLRGMNVAHGEELDYFKQIAKKLDDIVIDSTPKI